MATLTSDTVFRGETWRRQVAVSDANGPVDPTDVTAVLCPEVRMSVTRLSAGLFEVALTEMQTATLSTGEHRWEFWGRVGSDMTRITWQYLTVADSCGP